METFEPKRTFLIMTPGLISLVFGGLTGTAVMWAWAGRHLPISTSVEQHFYLVIAGFFAALIGNEVLNVLSFEWAGRPAGFSLNVAYAALLWATVVAVLGGNIPVAAVTYAVMLTILIYYALRVYFKPSRIGLKPSVYNYLIVASLVSSLAFAAVAHVFKGDVGIAMLYFPVSVIFAVMSRDMPLVTGTRPGGWALNALAFALITAAFSFWVFGAAALSGILLIASWVVALLASGLLRMVKKQRFFSYLKIHVAYFWMAAGGILLLLSSGRNEAVVSFPPIGGIMQVISLPGLWQDMAIHAIALGFIFNIVFGVDVVLLDMLMSQAPRKIVVKAQAGVPLMELVTFILLNAGLLTRAAYASAQEPLLALISGPLTGIAIVTFLLILQIRLRKTT